MIAAATRLLAAILITGLGVAAGRAAAQQGDAPPLPVLDLDAMSVSVSGVSSGGFMAQQLQVAFSATITGAGIIAAGPYGCAGSNFPWNVWRATNVCSNFDDGIPFAGPPPLERSLEAVRGAAARNAIDAPIHIATDRVYLFSGTLDATVPPAVMAVTEAFFQSFLANPAQQIAATRTLAAAHNMVTADFGNACDVSTPPYLADCDYAAAASLLAHIYGDLAPPAPAAAIEGRLHRFDQRPFVEGRRDSGLADVGYVFVPEDCEAPGARCRLHVALHGCQQSAVQIGETFVRHAGYNGLAAANRIVVLYPQAAPMRVAGTGGGSPAAITPSARARNRRRSRR
ncbi:MAG: PHB depolymerase family esterase [Rhodospirillales bacterium]|nr:PHB depolymerase family esterase [Rhodospirillales bacterium]